MKGAFSVLLILAAAGLLGAGVVLPHWYDSKATGTLSVGIASGTATLDVGIGFFKYCLDFKVSASLLGHAIPGVGTERNGCSSLESYEDTDNGAGSGSSEAYCSGAFFAGGSNSVTTLDAGPTISDVMSRTRLARYAAFAAGGLMVIQLLCTGGALSLSSPSIGGCAAFLGILSACATGFSFYYFHFQVLNACPGGYCNMVNTIASVFEIVDATAPTCHLSYCAYFLMAAAGCAFFSGLLALSAARQAKNIVVMAEQVAAVYEQPLVQPGDSSPQHVVNPPHSAVSMQVMPPPQQTVGATSIQ